MPETQYWYGLQPNLPAKSPTRFPEDPFLLKSCLGPVDPLHMGNTVTSMAEKRSSTRIVPIGSNEDIVILHIDGDQHLAKILDLSDTGVSVYVVEPDAPLKTDDTFRMALYHKEKIEDIDVKVCRKTGHLVGLEFLNLSRAAAEHVRAKIIRLEVEWMRMKPGL